MSDPDPVEMLEGLCREVREGRESIERLERERGQLLRYLRIVVAQQGGSVVFTEAEIWAEAEDERTLFFGGREVTMEMAAGAPDQGEGGEG